jgi:hypothetical protein
MSMATYEKFRDRQNRGDRPQSEIVACVTALCALSALPMVCAIALVLWG